MAIVDVHPESIDGPWIEGFVLDRHVVSSRPIGYVGEHLQFDTVRSPLGELVYKLKYGRGIPLTGRWEDDIIETALAFMKQRWMGCIDCVVPPPPSLYRMEQPAVLIAEGIARSLNVPTLMNAVVKATATQEMKNTPLYERVPLLTGAIQAGTDSVQGRRVLLVDDLWETGSTLRRVAEVLGQGGATEIRALVITRTK
ncbi:MAG: hypothetical protein A3G81_29050 [Betaproteobacteria bacterium RIFCSPLOWO2_12_FULL_65_14]|nr:MAG: hypothetical protein A3G81_29050 [Betaproteobacteria bacterium RIFCSPLOWO2_12_FULL_65_14]